MGTCYNIILEIKSDESLSFIDIDLNFFRDALGYHYYRMEFGQALPMFFRMNFCEHDDQLYVLLALAKIIEYLQSKDMKIVSACLDGLDRQFDADYWEGWEKSLQNTNFNAAWQFKEEVLNQKEYMLSIFNKIRILTKKDKGELQALKEKFNA